MTSLDPGSSPLVKTLADLKRELTIAKLEYLSAKARADALEREITKKMAAGEIDNDKSAWVKVRGNT